MKSPFLLSIVFFMALFSPLFASAAIVTGQLTDNSGQVQIPAFSSWTSIYSFTLSASTTFGGTSLWQFDLANVSGFAACGPGMYVDVSTSNSSIVGGFSIQPTQGANATNGVFLTWQGQGIATSTLGPGTYYFGGHTQCNPGTFYVRTNAAMDNLYGYITDNGGNVIPVTDTRTRIDSVVPAASSTVATSTAASIGASGYINENDYQSGMYLRVQYLLLSSNQAAIANPYNLGTTIDFAISTSGPFSFSTSTDISRVGLYTMYTSVRTPSFFGNFLDAIGFGQFATQNINTATTTQFTADHLTAFDVLVASTTNAMNAYLASSTVSLASCSDWTQLNLIDCLNLLFLPQRGPTIQALQDFKNGFLSLSPWGYLTRTIVILSSSATTTTAAFPLIHAALPDPANPYGNTLYYDFDQNEAIAGAAAQLDAVRSTFGDHTSIKDAMEPIVDAVVAFSVLSYIIYDLMRVRRSPSHSRTKLS